MTHPTTTIVTCIEAGPLEQEVLLLAKSLRTQPGPVAASDIVAFAPRRGPAISRETVKALSRLGASVVVEDVVKSYAWFATFNKPATMSFMERRVTTDYMTWMDGDIVAMDNLDAIVPTDGADFLCRAGESPLGTSGSDREASFWDQLAIVTGVDYRLSDRIESLPQKTEIREYYQSGVYSYRRDLAIGARQEELMKQVIDSRIGAHASGIYHHDQATLSLAAMDRAPRRARLPWRYNYNFNMMSPDSVDSSFLKSLALLHYHGSFHPAHWARAQSFFPHLPDATVALIEEYAPFLNTMGPMTRLQRRILQAQRDRKMKGFTDRVKLH